MSASTVNHSNQTDTYGLREQLHAQNTEEITMESYPRELALPSLLQQSRDSLLVSSQGSPPNLSSHDHHTSQYQSPCKGFLS